MPTRTVDGREVPEVGEYQIDPSHSTVEFVARHLMVSKVRGRFGSFSGSLHIADVPEESSVTAAIDTASVDTRDAGREEYLRSPGFFDVATYPEARFASTRVEASKGGWKVTGDLTIRDVTRQVVLDVEFLGAIADPWGNQRIAFSASAEVDREAWRLTWNQALEAGGVLVGKKVRLEFEVEAVRS